MTNSPENSSSSTNETAMAPSAEVSHWSRCPVCDGDTCSPHIAFDEVAFVRCHGCRSVYKASESRTLETEGFYEEDYFHGRKSARDKRFQHRVRKCRRQIIRAQQFAEIRSLLDIGCSFGYVLEAGNRLGLRTAGIDISKYAIKVCRERGYEAQTGDLHAFPYPDDSFDLVVMKQVLEHTPDPIGALAEVRRVLTAGGGLIIVVPDLMYWKGLFWKQRGRYFRPDELGLQHYVYYTTDSMRRLLQRAGFDVVADSKAVFRRKLASKGALAWIYEVIRYSAIAAVQFVTRFVLQQRELFFVAVARTPPEEPIR